MTSHKRSARGLLSIGGLTLLLAIPGGALAQSTPPAGGTGTQGTGTQGTQGIGTGTQGTGTGTQANDPTRPSTVPYSPSDSSDFRLGQDRSPSPLLGEDDDEDIPGLYRGTTEDDGTGLGLGGSGESPESLVPDPSTESDGVLNDPGSGTGGSGTTGSQIPGMDQTVPPDVEVPEVPATSDMNQQQGGPH